MKSKGLSFIWCALVLLFSTPAIAQDRITATLLPTQVNGEWTLELNLENPNESRYTALQLDIKLPVGFSIADNTATTSTRLPDHSLVVSNTTGNTYRVAAYSLTNTAIVGNSGCIASMTLRAHESAEEGAYYASLNNIIVSTRAGEEVDFNDYSFSWTYEKISSFYTITYWVDGEVFATQNYQEGASISLSDTPEKVGHTFVGWKDLPESMPGEDINVEALFTVNSYLLTFIVDGAVVKQESVAYGTAITAPEVEDKEGHTFSGWSAYPETMPATDVEVTATYTVNSYLLTFIVDGAVVKQESVAYGTAITAPEVEDKEGYTFSGWSAYPETMPATDVEVTATYTVNSYLLTFIVDGAVVKQETVAYGTAITAPEVEDKEGYTFSGWSAYPETMPATDVEVTATYTVNSYLLTFIIDGVVVKQESVAYGTAITAPEVEDKEGHTFSGWSAYPETMPATDVEVTATYTINTYKITYILDGEVYAEDSVAYGTVIIPVQIEEDETFTFSGWSNLPEVMPAHDIVVTGTTTLTAITALHATETRIDVYTLSGKLVARKVSPAWIKTGLTKGVYIINGKKVMIQ